MSGALLQSSGESSISCLFTLFRYDFTFVYCFIHDENFSLCNFSKGATGAVFQGVNKHNGEPVAVKTFNQLSHMRPYEVQMREFEVLRKVKHDNIVKLLAIEDDQEGRGKVIVMELCTGGSLFNILDDPENTYGLPQVEFLLVLEHLTAGMKHLRDNNLVHRDLKPGNIMKYLSEEGLTVYKLTDFGAARELEENQQFVSLYGTEEYLHPDMYERAVLRKSINRSFTANVDLWSIGVTLYHVATGNLPFRPYGGRKNKEMMHHITTKKLPGVIAGTQTAESGPIEWSRHLPDHCQLSAGLKLLVTPLLAGLLEENQKRMWSFERFFWEVTNILNKKVLHLFYMNRGSSIEIFMDPDEPLFHFKEHVNLQSDVNPDNQLLLFDEEHLEEKVGSITAVRGYPPTSIFQPIMLFSIENNNVSLPKELDLPKFPSFPAGVSVENDASLAKVSCSVGHECKRRVENFSRIDKLIQSGIERFIGLLKVTLNKLSEKSKNLEDVSALVHEFAETLELMAAGNETYHDEIKQIGQELAGLKEDFTRVSEPIQQLFNRFWTEDQLTREWKTSSRGIENPSNNYSNEKAKHLVERLRDSWQHLLRDRATRCFAFSLE
jgi:TANK-binding kinase 1